MRIGTDDGTTLDVDVAGDGPALVMVHGHGGCKDDFADHVEPLSRHHTVVRFDHRGHGRSDKPSDPDAYSLDRLTADLRAVVDELEIERFRLLGYSMGGMAARRFLLDEPTRVEAMIFMDTCGGPIEGWDPELMEIGARTALEQGKQATRELLDAFDPLSSDTYARMLRERPGYQDYQDAKWETTSIVAWGSLLRSMARQRDDHAALADVRCPTLVLVGAFDHAFIRAAQRLADAVPDATLRQIPDAAHAPQFENPPEWRASIESFLAGLEAPASL